MNSSAEKEDMLSRAIEEVRRLNERKAKAKVILHLDGSGEGVRKVEVSQFIQ